MYIIYTTLYRASCRTKATARVATQFVSPAAAEQHFSKLFTSTEQSSSKPTLATTSVATCVAESTELSVHASLQPVVMTSLPPTPVFLQSMVQSISSCGLPQSNSKTSCMPPSFFITSFKGCQLCGNTLCKFIRT